MTRIESIQFSCGNCGKRLGAKADQAGRSYRCPGCGDAVQVPRLANESPTVEPTIAPPPAVGRFGIFHGKVPSTIGELLLLVFMAWSVVAFVCLIAMFVGTVTFFIALAILALATAAFGHQAIKLMLARQAALSAKNVSLLWGTVRLIAWDPVEGVLILRNKAVSFADSDLHDASGGIRFVYPILGEELALRVPLETQTLNFADDNVLTREYLPLRIRGTMKWRIADVSKFYLLVSRELRSTRDARAHVNGHAMVLPNAPASREPGRVSGQLIDAAIEWLRGLAEEQTRLVVARVRSGLLIADRLMADVPEMRQLTETPLKDAEEFGGATEGLAGAIHGTLTDRLKDYGIVVADVSLQEIGMPPAIVEQCAEAAKTAYLPVMAQRQAAAKRMDLKAEADVIGAEAMATREVVRHAPAYALGDFLTKFVTQKTEAAANGGATPTIDVGKLAEEAAASTRAIEG